MPEQSRTRDCIILVKGDTYPVTIDDELATEGWLGGQGVQWSAPVKDEFLVKRSDGLYAGFMLWGSDETSDQFTAMTRNQPAYRFSTIGAGGWVIMTTTYEKYTYASRVGGGPLVPIVYQESDKLLFSLRGYWTSEDEWTETSDPRGANAYFIGFVVQSPTQALLNYMTIQVSI